METSLALPHAVHEDDLALDPPAAPRDGVGALLRWADCGTSSTFDETREERR